MLLLQDRKHITGLTREDDLGYISSFCEMITAVTRTAIFEAVVSGRMRLKYYDCANMTAL